MYRLPITVLDPFLRMRDHHYTVNDLEVKISTHEYYTQITTDTISISSIAPGATARPTNDVNITVSSRFSGIFHLDFEIMSGWMDILDRFNLTSSNRS